MVNQNELQRLIQAFPDSFLNANLEFIRLLENIK